MSLHEIQPGEKTSGADVVIDLSDMPVADRNEAYRLFGDTAQAMHDELRERAATHGCMHAAAASYLEDLIGTAPQEAIRPRQTGLLIRFVRRLADGMVRRAAERRATELAASNAKVAPCHVYGTDRPISLN